MSRRRAVADLFAYRADRLRTRKVRPHRIGFAILVACSMGNAGAQLVELGMTVPTFVDAANTGFVVANLDGIAGDEFVCATANALLVLGRDAQGNAGIKHSLVLADEGITTVLKAPAGNGPERLYAVSSTTSGVTSLTAYGGWPLRQLGRLLLPETAESAAIGDVDADGRVDLVVATGGSLAAYVLADVTPLWRVESIIRGSGRVVVAQLDGDPALEIISAGPTTRVYDGALGMDQGGRDGGFGQWIDAGRTGPSGSVQVIGSQWGGLSVFAPTAPWSMLWSLPLNIDNGSVMASDLDGDQRDEIIIRGSTQVHIVDSASHAVRNTFGTNGVAAALPGVGDVDADGSKDIAVATRGESSASPAPQLRVVDAATGQDRLRLDSEWGNFRTVALADLDNNGSLEQIVAADNYHSLGGMHVLGAAGGQLLWRAQVPSDDPFNGPRDMSYRVVVADSLFPGSTKEIVAAGLAQFAGRILVMDGVTKAIRLQIGGDNGPLDRRTVRDVVLKDFNDDGVLDIHAATDSVSLPGNGSRLHVFSGLDGALLAQSAFIAPTSSGSLRNLLLGDVDADGEDELIVVRSDSTRSFDSKTLQQKWTMLATAAGGSYLPRGLEGPEILLFTETGSIRFHDARTRAFLRSLPAPQPLTAVRAVGGNPRELLVVGAGRLHLLQGESGDILASGSALGSEAGRFNQLAVANVGDNAWQVAVGSVAGYFRYRLNTAWLIMRDGFDGGAEAPSPESSMP